MGQLQCQRVNTGSYENLCTLATTFRKNKEKYTEEEMIEIQNSINFLIEKIQQVTGKRKIEGKLDMKIPLPDVLKALNRKEA